MYYFELLDIIKESSGFLSSNDIFEKYAEKFETKPNRINLLKALAKLREREDIKFMSYKRTYLYKYINLGEDN